METRNIKLNAGYGRSVTGLKNSVRIQLGLSENRFLELDDWVLFPDDDDYDFNDYNSDMIIIMMMIMNRFLELDDRVFCLLLSSEHSPGQLDWIKQLDKETQGVILKERCKETT